MDNNIVVISNTSINRSGYGRMAKTVGLKGMIVDGCVRGKAGAIELGLPIFAKGFMQRGPAKIY